MLKVSFTKIPLRGTFTPRWPFHTELYARCLYLESGEEKLLICAFDTLGTFGCDAKKFRVAAAAATGIPEKSIIFHELQVHAAPSAELMHTAIDSVIERAIPELQAFIKKAVPCSVEVMEADFGDECTFNREQYVEGLGGVTVWTGMTFDEKGRPCTQNKAIMLLREYRPDLPVFDKPIYFDNMNDPKAYLFRFIGEDGKTIGTVTRFAAHPDVGVLFELRPVQGKAAMYHYDFDWPGYLSTRLEQDYGGMSMYLNGPCGDLSSKKGYDGIDDFEASDRECQRLGNWFAEKMEKAFEQGKKVMPNSDFLRTDTFTVTVPMRDDMPTSIENANNGQQPLIDAAKKKFEDAMAQNQPAYLVKKAVDNYWKAMYNRMMATSICGFTDEELQKREVVIEIPIVRFGPYLFVGVPGESLTEMATWLRSTFTGVKTIPLDQCDGYYSYMATPRSLKMGGYTYWCSWTTPETIPSMKAQMIPKINAFLELE